MQFDSRGYLKQKRRDVSGFFGNGSPVTRRVERVNNYCILITDYVFYNFTEDIHWLSNILVKKIHIIYYIKQCNL